MSEIKDFKADIQVVAVDSGKIRWQSDSKKQRITHGVDGLACFLSALKWFALLAEVFGIADQAKEVFASEIELIRKRAKEKAEQAAGDITQ